MAVDEIFDDAFFASIYDLFNEWDAWDDFYLDMALEIGGDVLDLGCGTGRLACRMAAEGLNVTGADPAAGMLRVARSRTGNERVTWVQSDGQSLRLAERFDFVYMTGHAFQTMLTDAEAVALLTAVAAHLKPHGRFVFDTRNPAAKAWLDWTPDGPRAVVDGGDRGRIEEINDTAADPATGIVEIIHRYRFLDTGAERVGHSRIRFIDRDHLAGLVDQAGLTPVVWYGDSDRSPYTPDSPEIVAVLRRRD